MLTPLPKPEILSMNIISENLRYIKEAGNDEEYHKAREAIAAAQTAILPIAREVFARMKAEKESNV